MKIFPLLLVLYIFSFAGVNSQTFQWLTWSNHSIPVNSDYVQFPSDHDLSGNLISGSISLYKQTYGQDVLGDIAVKKYTATGQLLFTKVITGKVSVKNICTDGSGNIYVSGVFKDTIVIEPGNFMLQIGFTLNSYIIKFSSSGQFIWKKNLAEVYISNLDLEFIKIKNNFILLGVGNYIDGYIKKFDLNGNEIQSISIISVNLVTGIDIDGNGNIYAAGACFNGNKNFGGLPVVAPYSYNKFTSKFNSNGSGIWVKFVQDVTLEVSTVICDNNNNIISCGRLMNAAMFGNISVPGPHWVYDFFIAKQDTAGTYLWVKDAPNSGGDATTGSVKPLALDNNNNIYFAGFQRQTINWGNGVITSVSGLNRNLLLLKYDQNGSILWGKVSGGVSDTRTDEINISTDNSILISGNFTNTAVFDTIAAAGTGQVNSYFAKLSNPALTSVSENQISGSFRLSQNYPNPFNPSTKIKFYIPGVSKQFVNISVYNSTGQLIETIIDKELQPGEFEIEWQANDLPSGIYFYKLISTKFSHTRKMILIK